MDMNRWMVVVKMKVNILLYRPIFCTCEGWLNWANQHVGNEVGWV